MLGLLSLACWVTTCAYIATDMHFTVDRAACSKVHLARQSDRVGYAHEGSECMLSTRTIIL
jgi:hypothetical protein